ncbi:MAG: hypothetical protein EZS28_014191 [Streblomastix strix]|uniref:Uncharacterized protein n=1 Tax=Streblomastix strix TaxID=222440 RepID=A0A5J4W6K5_9EUKA|nr:MAG: hypothetical protein EZS28_014191 [Streblomastix strix]
MCFVRERNSVSLINYQVYVVQKHGKEPCRILRHGKRHEHSFDISKRHYTLYLPTGWFKIVHVAPASRSLQFIIRTEYTLYSISPSLVNRIIESGFSGGIIKSVIHSYRKRLAQFLVSTGNSLNIGFNQLRSNTPLKVMGSDSNGIINCEVRQRIRTDDSLFTSVNGSFPKLANGAAAVFSPLKLVNYRAYSMSVVPSPLVVLTQLSWIPKVLAGIVIVQLTQHVQTQQQVAAPLAPSGARVYLVPPENNVLTINVRITSLRAEYEDAQSECDAFDSLARYSLLHGVTSAAKWVAPVLHKVMGAVAPTIGAINPTAGMIARGVGGAAGMANKFLNR